MYLASKTNRILIGLHHLLGFELCCLLFNKVMFSRQCDVLWLLDLNYSWLVVLWFPQPITE